MRLALFLFFFSPFSVVLEYFAGTVTYKTVIMFGHFVLFNVYNISGISKKHMMAVANDHGGLAFNMAHGAPIYSNSV